MSCCLNSEKLWEALKYVRTLRHGHVQALITTLDTTLVILLCALKEQQPWIHRPILAEEVFHDISLFSWNRLHSQKKQDYLQSPSFALPLEAKALAGLLHFHLLKILSSSATLAFEKTNLHLPIKLYHQLRTIIRDLQIWIQSLQLPMLRFSTSRQRAPSKMSPIIYQNCRFKTPKKSYRSRRYINRTTRTFALRHRI